MRQFLSVLIFFVLSLLTFYDIHKSIVKAVVSSVISTAIFIFYIILDRNKKHKE